MYERENILRIFKETKEAMSRNDAAKIKNLSNQTTNSASLTHDPDNIAAAVIVYSLSKIIERESYRKNSGWEKFYNIYVKTIDKIIESIKGKDDEFYRKNISDLRDAINKLSGGLKSEISEVFRKASINKASKIYEHGISMEKTANLLGITLYELAQYAGSRDFFRNQEYPKSNVKLRIKTAMEMFQWKLKKRTPLKKY